MTVETPEPDEVEPTTEAEPVAETDSEPVEEKPTKPKKPSVKLKAVREAAHARQTAKGDDIGLIEQALVAERLLAPRYANGRWGSMKMRAYRRWQRRLSYRGRAADGIPDVTSLKRLGDKHGFDVK